MRLDREQVLEKVRIARDRFEVPDLRDANLRGADLRDANLRDADLRDADLYGADLRGADLYGADLRGADLRDADLYGADLYGANLRDADLYGLFMDGLPSGALVFIPTKNGWCLSIGCWSGNLDDLENLLGRDDVYWPEARGEERVKRESILRPVLSMCRAYADAHPDACAQAEEAAKKWEKERVS